MLRLPALAAALAALLPGQNCANTSTGLVPLPQLAGGSYQGFAGGLYPGHQNQPPAAHLQAALARAAAIAPRAAGGQPDPNGRIVLLSIGMSNTTQEFSTWQRFSAADGDRNPRLAVVDGAQGSQDAAVFANPQAAAWTVVDQRLQAAGVTAAQVQVVWLKQATANPVAGFPAHAVQLQGYLQQIAQNLTARFPNLQLAYLSSRTYGGYALNPQRSEPLSYETAFAVQGLIAAQIQGDPALNPDPANGPVRAPLLLWGPYLWADGTTPRADGRRWACADFLDDGVHPSQFGRYQVAQQLDAFFRSEPTATPWYLGGNGQPIAAVLPIGSGCPTPLGAVGMQANGLPRPGNAGFALGAARLPPGAPAALVFGAAIARLELVRGCDVYLDLPQAYASTPLLAANGAGSVVWPMPLPNAPALLGGRTFAQWAALDAAGAPFPGAAVRLSLSPAAELRIGN